MKKILRQIRSVWIILKNNIKRSFLTSMGIIVATAIYIFGNAMAENFNEMSYMNYFDFPDNGILINDVSKATIDSFEKIQYDDYKYTYSYAINKKITNLTTGNFDCTIEAVLPNYYYFPSKSVDTYNSLEPLELVAGRYLNDDDFLIGNPVVNVSEAYAKLFFDGNPLGKSIFIDGIDFEIVGILKTTSDVERVCKGDNISVKVITTTSCLKKLNLFNNGKYHITILSNDVGKTSYILEKELNLSCNTKNRIINNINESNKGVITLLNVLLIVIVIISCIIILITMLFNIKERIFEYGIKMAIGADKNDISFGVLIEGLIYSFLGIIFGFGLGFISSITYSLIIFITTGFFCFKISAIAIVTGVLIPLTSVMVFSLIPALIISKKNIVDCLKAE